MIKEHLDWINSPGWKPEPDGTLVEIELFDDSKGKGEVERFRWDVEWDNPAVIGRKAKEWCIKRYRVIKTAEKPDTVTKETVTKETVSKETNPKDAVGIRKAPLSVVPMNVVAEIGIGMLEGASKYGRHNYRGVGVRASVYFDATMRHLIDWWEGVDIDPDSGMHHVTKAMCSLAVLRDAMIRGMCTDDRPPSSEQFYQALNEKAAEIIDKHADKKPKHWTIEDETTKGTNE